MATNIPFRAQTNVRFCAQVAGTYNVTITLLDTRSTTTTAATHVQVATGSVTVAAGIAVLTNSPITSPPVTQRSAIAGTPLKFRVQPQDWFGNHAELPAGNLSVLVSVQEAAARLPNALFAFRPFQLVRHLSNADVSF